MSNLPLINVGVNPNDGTGDLLRTALIKTNAGLSALNTLTSNTVPGNLTIAQLNTQYTSANVTGNQTVSTVDAGLVTFNGTSWQSLPSYTLQQTAVKFIRAPAGTMNNNGAFVLGTSLDNIYPSAYMWFWTGAITPGTAGWYYVVMTTLVAGTVYNYKYRFGQPVVPTSLTGLSFVTTGPGAWTNPVNTLVTGPTFNTPAFGTGLNGRLDVKVGWTASNTTGSKALAPIYNGASISSDTQTNGSPTNGYTTTRTIINKGQLGSQYYTGTNGTGTALGQGSIAVDGSKANSFWYYLNIETATTDWMVIHYSNATMFPSGLIDTPITPSLTPAGPNIVPPGAAALGYTSNVWFVNPTLAMVSNSSATPLNSVSSLSHYSNATINGINYLSINQLGDGVNTACFTSPPATLATLLASNGMYFEAAITLTSNDFDHWPALYSNPIEKTGNGAFPYVELDWMEQIGARSATDPYYGSTNSVINWATGSSGSPAPTNNLNPTLYGPNVDWTQEHIFGGSYDPINKVVAFWMDGVQLPEVVNVSAYNANISPLHYVLVLQAASHTSGAGGVPYSMLVRYFSAWT